jgi:limonene-1,2-epoxide hydrolase
VNDLHPFGAALEGHDPDGAVAQLAEDVVFRSPIVFAEYKGRSAVAPLIHAVSHVFEDFRYVRAIGADDAADHALVFQARVNDRQVEGCDFIHVRDDGLVDELVVMVRPLSAAIALAERMNNVLRNYT